MATNLDYQRARRIRNTGFADLLSDQLAGDATIGGALKKTISLRTQAKIKGIKEKFDPLNIAKFLTGGSSLGPALLGKLTGRSEKDIQYFSGRMRPIRERGTASRIGREPGTGMSEGVNEMLRKIYYLMQITRESDLERSDKELNFAEEKKLEDEKRHKELLKVLSNLAKGNATVTEEKSNRGLLDSLMDLLRRVPALPIPTAAGKGLGKLLRNAGGFLLSPPVLALLGVAGTAWLLKYLYDNDTPKGDDTAASKGKSDVEMAMEYGPEGPPRARPNLEEVANERKVQNRMADFNLRLRNMRADDDRKKIYLRNYVESSDPVDKEAATRLMAEIKPPKMTAADFQKTDKDTTPVTVIPNASGALPSTGTNVTPPVAPATSTNVRVTPSAAMASGTTGASNLSLPSVMAPPAAVSGTNLTARLNAVTNENLYSGLTSTKPVPASVVNNVNTAKPRQMPQNAAELNTIAVRNMDPTFMRLIMDNTRVV